MAPTILIVDDDRESQLMLAVCLQHYGFKTLEAQSVWDGLEMAEVDLPDLIIFDNTLPKRPGYFLLENIRTNSTTAHIPFLMIFNASRPLEELHNNQTWIEDAFVYSPYMPQDLIEAINRLLEQSYLR